MRPLHGRTATSLFFPTIDGVAGELEQEGKRGWLRLDVATGQVRVLAPPPWEYGRDPAHCAPTPRALGRTDAAACARWVCATKGAAVAVGTCLDALAAVAAASRFDSVADALAELPPWDGVVRLPDLAQRVGIEAGDAAAVAAWLVASLRRTARPGAPLEDLLLVEGAAALRAYAIALCSLAPGGLSLDAGFDLDPRFPAAARRLLGRTLVVVGDLSLASPREVALLATFAARTRDEEDGPPRRCGFAGLATARLEERVPGRFLPVRAAQGVRPRPLTPAERDHFLAEALVRLDDDAHAPAARGDLLRGTEDPWEHPVWAWLCKAAAKDRTDGLDHPRPVTTTVLLRECIRMPMERWSSHAHNRLGALLRGWRFEQRTMVDGGRRVRAWAFPADVFETTANDVSGFHKNTNHTFTPSIAMNQSQASQVTDTTCIVSDVEKERNSNT